MVLVALVTLSCSLSPPVPPPRSLGNPVTLLSQLSPPPPLLTTLQGHTLVVVTPWGFFHPTLFSPEPPFPAQGQSTQLFPCPQLFPFPPALLPSPHPSRNNLPVPAQSSISAALLLTPPLHAELLGSCTPNPAAALPSEHLMPLFSPHPASKMPLSSSSALDYALSRLLLPDTRNLSSPKLQQNSILIAFVRDGAMPVKLPRLLRGRVSTNNSLKAPGVQRGALPH